ncbi:MAG: membrane dipeptidase [Caulobacteraceae bacterium]
MSSTVICDLTLPFQPELEGREAILDRFVQSPIDFVSLTMGVDSTDTGDVVHNIAGVREMLRKRSDRMVFCKTVAEIRAAKAEGKLAVGFHFQGIGALEADPDMVALFYELGVRHMLLVYNEMNAAATGCHERVDAGLSRYGQKLVRECNRVGMILDCTHTGYRAGMEIMELSTTPVIFSHSNARALWDHERNITDEQALAAARTGGLVGVTGVGKFLSEKGAAEVEDLMPHIRHFVDLVGPDHVGLGIDNVFFLEQHYRKVAAHPDRWPKGYPPPPWHYFAPEQMDGLIEALSGIGLSDAQRAGILGENYLRIAEAVWR